MSQGRAPLCEWESGAFSAAMLLSPFPLLPAVLFAASAAAAAAAAPTLRAI